MIRVEYVEKIEFYDNGEGISRLPLGKLPLGDIKPDGWIKEQLKLMSRGITGRLPEYGPFFKKEANGFLYPETSSGWEEVPYWFRGYYPLAVLLNDENMLEYAQKYIDAVFASAQEDGWFGPAYLKTYGKTDKGDAIPDVYPDILLTDALFLYYEHTKDERVLSLYGKFIEFCLNLPDEAFLPKTTDEKLMWQKIRSGDMIPQLHYYYEITGDDNALKLAKIAYKKVAKSVTGFCAVHAVDIAHRFAYDALFFRQSKEKAHWQKSLFEYEKIKKVWGQLPRGIIAADEQVRAGAVDPRQGFEPCAMVELAKKFYDLGRISGETVYADETEDVMLNHFVASFTENYEGVRYLTAANMPVSDDYRYSQTYNGTNIHDCSFFIMTPNNRCCGHNTGMGWTWYVMNLWQKTADGGLAAYLYAPNVVETTVNGQKICLKTETNYPFNGNVKITVTKDGEFPLYFRLPKWNTKCALSLNGAKTSFYSQKSGYVRIERKWERGDQIILDFDMEISYTRWAGNGSVSINRGPFTYSVRIEEEYSVVKDAGTYNHPEPHLFENYEIKPLTSWNYGLCFDGKDILKTVKVKKIDKELPLQPFSNKNAPVVLSAKVKTINAWKMQNGTAAELQQSPVYADTEETEIELIPLGCARLRISCLPTVTENERAFRWEGVNDNVPIEERPQGFKKQYDL